MDDHGPVDRRASLAVERSAVIAAARRFLEAHDRVVGSDKATGVTRDDAYEMQRRADELRDVLRLHDENAAMFDAAAPSDAPEKEPPRKTFGFSYKPGDPL